ncbi:MAG: hypothetical protein A2408_02985 [Candidatus Yonathbacteria bacterium RIFOXYC1_FULL_52_10]|uniref:Uncharacterized protein n=1 Tax=Candidatus Yonathbacteria bacterium RIFOXYD1_FULL_52_36 TaxID=1802730 RepID=A0A1G2SI61_9BACT|nr:MAG: hypothetical protein A2408_02985 [Candidatus Yonathbacteria bacterium RIFOXYC1_FULL_52_10]OHA84644.1 MAG: hypothetical protein A2591_02880 [Candidatus Yonathbacteria bacterium RIFOXYD1_FULL_52_36]
MSTTEPRVWPENLFGNLENLEELRIMLYLQEGFFPKRIQGNNKDFLAGFAFREIVDAFNLGEDDIYGGDGLVITKVSITQCPEYRQGAFLISIVSTSAHKASVVVREFLAKKPYFIADGGQTTIYGLKEE